MFDFLELVFVREKWKVPDRYIDLDSPIDGVYGEVW
jgi:hypothetical protein